MQRRSITEIIEQVELEDRAQREADMGLHHQLNVDIDWMFRELNTQVIRQKFNHPLVDKTGPVAFSVRQGDQTVCAVTKSTGHIAVEFKGPVDRLELYDDADEALTEIIRVLKKRNGSPDEDGSQGSSGWLV